jgi:hypothetical protein
MISRSVNELNQLKNETNCNKVTISTALSQNQGGLHVIDDFMIIGL